MAAIAIPADRNLFERFVRAYLTERHDAGSEILPTDTTITFYLGLFDAYMDGSAPGAVIISNRGVSMAGHAIPFDMTWGKTATGWLTYVSPEFRGHGEASELRQLLRTSLLLQGFRSIAFGVDINNETGIAALRRRNVHWTQMYGVEVIA